MLQNKISALTIAIFLTYTSLHAMDMDRVNALAAQFSGKIEQVKAPTVEVVAPVAKAVEPIVEKVTTPSLPTTEAVDVIPEKSVETTPKSKVIATVTEESLGLRKTDLYAEEAETAGEATSYGTSAAGSSKIFERAFENAPPMISHDVEGMLPIKIGNNACTGCHMPEVAPSMKATAIPASHFASFRPSTGIGEDGRITKEGKGVDNTSDLKTVSHKLDKLSGARFNCTLCHAPQSTQAPLVGNTFTPDFSANGAKSSNLINTMNEGVK